MVASSELRTNNVKDNKKILLYGGTGFVGSAINNAFKNSYTVIAPTHSDLDVTDFFFLRENILHTKPDVIIYASGLASVDKCEQEPQLASLLNTKVPGVIASEAAVLHIPVYYLSTDAVFRGNKKDSPYKETDRLDPFSVYGKTKVAGEEVILKSSAHNSVIRIICPFNAFYARKTDFVRLAIEKLSKHEHFPGITDQTMNPLYLPYLTKALLKLLSVNANGIYHLGATDCDTNFNIVKRLAKELHLDDSLISPITLETFLKNKRALRSKYSLLDVSKFQRKFGEGILNNIDTSLKDFSKCIANVKLTTSRL